MAKRAVLAGGWFWGMEDLIRTLPACSKRASATRAGTCRRQPIVLTARMPRASRSSRSEAAQLPTHAGVLLSNPRSDHEEPRRQRHRQVLQVRNLVRRCRREADRRRPDRGRRSVRSVERQGRDGGQAGWRRLGGGAEASGLPGALPNGYTCHFLRPTWVVPKGAGVAWRERLVLRNSRGRDADTNGSQWRANEVLRRKQATRGMALPVRGVQYVWHSRCSHRVLRWRPWSPPPASEVL